MDVSTIDFWIMIATSLLCGGVVGFERQLRGKPAGVRTSILMCLGTSLFISLGKAETGETYSDTTRVLGQVVTGIGFLGAGVILTRKGAIVGVTSAAVIWMLAAIGAIIGFEHYLEAIALSFVTVVVLIGIGLLEGKYEMLRKGVFAPGTNNSDNEK
ncbi:MAG: MgtC/SapB family protein [Dehalococcoidia bacterium]